MPKSFSKNYEIHYYEADSNLKCKLPSIVNFICDVGTDQSESLGGGIEYCTENNCAWVFFEDDIVMHRYPEYGETISITTVPEGFKKFYGLRKYIIKDKDENIIGEAKAIFFLIDIQRRRPMRIQKEQYEMYGISGDTDLNCDDFIEKIKNHNPAQYVKEFNVRYSDIDSNHHVNNVKYIEWSLEAVPVEIFEKYEISRLRVIFEKECVYGEKVTTAADFINENSENMISYHTIKNEKGKVVTILEAEWRAL